MKTAEFDYELPQSLIAQAPIEPRDASRLLLVGRDDGTLSHHHFRDLSAFLKAGDTLVANDSRVLPARLCGRRADTGGRVEILLVTPRGDNLWEALVKPGRRVREGGWLEFDRRGGADGDPAAARLRAQVVGRTEFGGRLLRFAPTGDPRAAIESVGEVPLPPYIRTPLDNRERYQTVYARWTGSAAAPTAGLHFTPELIAALRHQGIGLVFVTLHVGLDTFRPVRADELEDHQMHAERATLDEATAGVLNEARRSGGRIIAVGTTAVRVLESAAGDDGRVRAFDDWTKLFVYPGYRFRSVDGLITNFHLPRSTLLMMVSAFAGRAAVLNAYREAARLGYRFYSFGDAMLIL